MRKSELIIALITGSLLGAVAAGITIVKEEIELRKPRNKGGQEKNEKEK